MSEADFDAMFGRITAAGIPYGSGPPNPFDDMKISHRDGGRAVYFRDPDGHIFELLAADRALTAMRDGGRVAHPKGVEPPPKVRPGVSLSSYDVVVDQASIDKLNRLIEAGPFEVHVARTFRLDQAADAHRALGDHYLGKLALQLN